MGLEQGLNVPCGHVVGVHTQAGPKCGLEFVGLLFREAVGQLDPAMLEEMVNILL